MPVDWLNTYAERVDRVQSSIIREILKMMAVPGVISFAGGMPAPELFPKNRMAEVTARLLASEEGTAALQYAVTDGYVPLRELILERMKARGLTASLDNIFITSGAQQGLDLVGKLLIDAGDRVLVEDPTYLGALQAWNIYGATYETVDTDENGIIPEALEAALQKEPASLLYLVPTFQNPTGITLSAERRQQVVEIAAKYSVPVIEDDPYGELRFEGEHINPLVAYDAQTNGVYKSNTLIESNVIYLGTFSKTLCPGLRIGWVIVVFVLLVAAEVQAQEACRFSYPVGDETTGAPLENNHRVGGMNLPDFGTHLGADDGSLANARRVLGQEQLLGATARGLTYRPTKHLGVRWLWGALPTSHRGRHPDSKGRVRVR